MKKTKFNIVLGLAVCALLLSTAVIAKHSVERPFKINGNSAIVLDIADIEIDPDYPDYGPYVCMKVRACGEATHMGRCQMEGTDRIYFVAGFQEGSGTITAANGDEVEYESFGISGSPQVTMTFTAGTGRFENASGGFSAESTLIEEKWDGPVLTGTYIMTGTGTITY